MFKSIEPFPKIESVGSCCIYKASDRICKSNELEAYTPQVISIGPFHRNNPKLQTMESFKQRYLKSFTERAPEMNLDDLISTIKGEEESVRECYSETIPLGSDDFVKMILLDAIFIIEFFFRNCSGIWSEYDRRMLASLLSNRGQLDLILLENQLPFFIIEKIYNIAFPSLSIETPFIDFTCRQFHCYNVQEYEPRDFWSSGKIILHFTDLLRSFSLPRRERRPKRNSEIIKEMRSTTQLARAGLKFTVSNSNNCSPLELKYANGVLEIPRFQLDKNTEIYARNLIAFEQSHYPEDQAYITEYYFLLSLLIRGRKDVIFLVRKGIVKWVDQGIDPASVLNKILETIDCSLKTDDYTRGTYLHIMTAKLKRDYFSTPWKGAATIGGILLLLLTVIQTV
ncbi:hypothetical protein I3760_15G111700 [Carya illinoinensis]|nr:hypothetical protein I3760_15G111700 [Carya illinoinensis]